MSNRFSWILILAWLLLLGGCADMAKPPSGATIPPTPMVGGPQAGENVNIVPLAPVLPEPLQSLAMSGNPAVIALLDRAQNDNDAGQREASGASLERALRIEPRNPWLWQQLAQLRLAQGQYAQAITLARKSNSLAGKQRRVQAENWQVIAKARTAQGDSAGAEQALKLAADFLQ